MEIKILELINSFLDFFDEVDADNNQKILLTLDKILLKLKELEDLVLEQQQKKG